MKALILNSGLGSRMGDLTREHPKAMTEIAPGETIVSRQLRLLSAAGVRKVVMTTGIFEAVLRDYCESLALPLDIEYVNNPISRETNYIYSIDLARELLREDFLMRHPPRRSCRPGPASDRASAWERARASAWASAPN